MLESLGLQTIPAEEGGTSSQSAVSKTLGEVSMKGPTAAPHVKKGTVHNPDKGKQIAQAKRKTPRR